MFRFFLFAVFVAMNLPLGLASAQPNETMIHGDGTPRPRRQPDLVIVSVAGPGQITRFTDTLAHEGDARWSPDGTRIVFTETIGQDNDLMVVNVDRSGKRNLTNSPDTMEQHPSWTPDSSRILFIAGVRETTRREGSNISSISVESTNVYSMKSDGTDTRRLTEGKFRDVSPVMSAGGKTIAFSSDRDGRPEIFLMDADGSNLRQLTNSPDGSHAHSPTWSPTGGQLAYVQRESANGVDLSADIYICAADGSATIRVTTTTEFEFSPAWSPDGEWIAFCSTGSERGQLLKIRPSGADRSLVSSGAITINGHGGLSWSPDSRRIVASAGLLPTMSRDLSAYTLWDSGGISIGAGGDDTPRFISATLNADKTVTYRPMTETEARAWFAKFRLPFPESPD